MVQALKLPDAFVEMLRQLVSDEDASIFTTCEFMADSWDEFGPAITDYLADQYAWSDAEKTRKAHSWFIESASAHVGMHPTSMYDRMRVGRNIIQRGLHVGDHDNLTFGHWCALMRNAPKDGEELISIDIISERLEWVDEQTDVNQGQPPSVRDIQKEFRQRGDKPEWLLHWNSVERNLNNLLDSENVPMKVKNLVDHILNLITRFAIQEPSVFPADADSTGGTR